MTGYPIVIRNRASWIVRGFMVVWLAILLVATAGMITHPPRPFDPWLELVLGVFWIVGIGITFVSLGMEETTLTITGPGRMTLRRGPPWRRVDLVLTTLDLKITADYDSDNSLYYRLMIDAAPKPVAIKEGHRRETIDNAKATIEAAFAGRPLGEARVLA